MQYQPHRRNLICVLDWGLGHASRSLALAHRLEAAGEVVVWAAAGSATHFLRREHPAATVLELPAYGVRYPTQSMVWNVLRQAPRWWRVARRERKLMADYVKEHGVDRIISDNRFGCFVRGVNNVWLSHQLHPIVPLGTVGVLYRRYLRRRFQEFWVPDYGDDERLSGKLSAPVGYPAVKFIGPLSRLGRAAPPNQSARQPRLRPQLKGQRLLLLLSGPEPARSHLEGDLVRALEQSSYWVSVVRGLPSDGAPSRAWPGHWEIVDFADAERLAALLVRADLVICRSGYSSLMDLRVLNKSAVLIPTPGQTEQLYLAARAEAQGWATALSQNEVWRIETVVEERWSVKKR